MDTSRLKKLLREQGYSITKQRLHIFETLQKTEEPITVVQLSKSLKKVDTVSVYRAIELFEKIGIVQRVWSGFKSKVELSESFSSHHHHFTCLQCGKTIGLKSEMLEADLKTFELEHGFTLIQHSVELSGYCAQCKK